MKINTPKAKSQKTYKIEGKLREIFQDRTNTSLGLTKQETICLFYYLPMSSVIRLKEDKINQLWAGIFSRKREMRKESNMAIISALVPKGTLLNDTIGHFGVRVMISPTWVYYNCSDMDSARQVKGRLDKISQGIDRAGEQIQRMVLDIPNQRQSQKQVMRILNEGILA